MRIEAKWLCLFLGMCASNWHPGYAESSHIKPVYQWKQLEFDYASEMERQQAIDNGDFNQIALAPIDVDVYYSGAKKTKVFITIPRFPTGVPASLGTVTDKVYNGNPVIAPYPSWGWHQNLEACPPNRIVSVFRVKIDECGRLWVLDTGRVVDKRICPAQILAFDLQTDELIHRYEIPEDQLYSNSILVTPIVDVREPHLKCRDTFVYVADCQANALIVYDVKREISWKIVDKTMYPYPDFGTYKLAGEQFDLMDGILGMDLSPYKPGEDRILFYHAMSSATENKVYTSEIRNYSTFEHDPSAAPQIFTTYSSRRRTQVPAQAIDKNGISYFGLVSDLSLNCWNTATEYGEKNIGTLAQDDQTLQFMSGIKVVTNRKGNQELWFVTMRFQKIAAGTVDPNDVNFRIQAAKVEDITRGSKCLNAPSSGYNNNNNQGYQGSRPSYVGGYGYSRHSRNHRRGQTNSVRFPNN